MHETHDLFQLQVRQKGAKSNVYAFFGCSISRYHFRHIGSSFFEIDLASHIFGPSKNVTGYLILSMYLLLFQKWYRELQHRDNPEMFFFEKKIIYKFLELSYSMCGSTVMYY